LVSDEAANSEGSPMCLSDVTVSDLERVASKSHINMSRLMTDAYCAIGDPDGIYGCNADQHRSSLARSVRCNVLLLLRFRLITHPENVEKPGKVGEFQCSRGKVRDNEKSQGKVSENCKKALTKV